MNNWALALYHKGMEEDNMEDLNSSLEKLDKILKENVESIPKYKTHLNSGNVLLAKA
jgi:hypothetical protein